APPAGAQRLAAALQDSDFPEAARLAFGLKHPGRLLKIITRAATATANASTAAASTAIPTAAATAAAAAGGPLGRLLSGLVGAMSDSDIRTALEYCRDWNTHAKHCHAAQALLGAVLRAHSPEKLLGISGLSELLAALTAYSGRHFSRLDRLALFYSKSGHFKRRFQI
ncbi:Transducin beta-like protein 3, partial [Tetrabaena socialis]